jgi:DNA-binding CsgD family transcriptional regulator
MDDVDRSVVKPQERDLITCGRPGRSEIVGWTADDSVLVCAICVHDEDVSWVTGSVRDLRAIRTPVWYLVLELAAERQLHQLGERERGASLVEEEVGLAKRIGIASAVGVALHGLALVRDGRGVDGLVERRVALMAGEGANNRDIAEALFVTRGTVEIHLTHAYDKLGVESRQGLAVALKVVR